MPVTPPIEAPLIEVFSSLQGEGVLIGARQVFVRFAECNLNCAYCDTPFVAGASYRLETAPGSGQNQTCNNPCRLDALTETLALWIAQHPGLHHSLVLTGGEPLLHAPQLMRWLPQVRKFLPIFLETNGTLIDSLIACLADIDLISMDVKLESVTGEMTPWNDHQRFIGVAKDRLCQVKIVVGKVTTQEEVCRAAELVAAASVDAPLIIQPQTCASGFEVDGSLLLALQAAASDVYSDVRVIPQVHPWLGVA
ncbi:MAG: 7-carboxy-7-deazaguanine synthase QueE [Desulfuromonadales bacterium]|nr:7-carboxy-7-deazaguanine synthase QueE [Desulfuromonadales bacterium]